MSLTRLDYCQFLLTSPVNYTLTYFADHVKGLSHDRINRYLAQENVTAEDLWQSVQKAIVTDDSGYLLFDDTVLDKRYSSRIEAVYKQYSGNEHTVIRGIGVITCVYVNPKTQQFWAIDYRIYDPKRDGKSKLDHVEEMLSDTASMKELPFSTVLMDSWYATQPLMKCVDELAKIYYTVVKKNRLVDETQGVEAYQKIEDLSWSEDELVTGKRIKLYQFSQFNAEIIQSKAEKLLTQLAEASSVRNASTSRFSRASMDSNTELANQCCRISFHKCSTGLSSGE
jgi:hypothetical protein